MTPEELVKKIKKSNDEKQKKLTLTNEATGATVERWIVEGDVGLSEERLLPYASERVALARRLEANDPTVVKRGLVAIESGGKILRWPPGMVLDYCVRRKTFASDEEHARVVRDMELATAAWSALCGVEFRYLPKLDKKKKLAPGDVHFPVQRHPGGGDTIAMAFFPDDPPKERAVWVFDGFFDANPAFAPVGVLRHELGHALGFRHEHIRPEAPDFFDPESTEHTVFLTGYDPQSVMHYVAPGVGNPQLTFTDSDREGARRVYGAPLSDFTFPP